MLESIKNVIDDLDLSESEKETVKGLCNKIHEAFEALKPKAKPKASEDSDSTKETD